jgi:glutamate:GABA antiporter
MPQLQNKEPRRFMNVFILAMMNLAIMVSIRNLTLVAEYGLGSVFLYLIIGIGFLLPTALVSAELATGWSRTGGVYVWVREGLGPRWGFFAIWMQWIHSVPWYPVILSFVGANVGFLIYPPLADNKIYLFFVIVSLFWLITLINFTGLKISSWFSTFCVICGTIVPGIFIIFLGLFWLSAGHGSYVDFSWKSFFPDFRSIKDFVFLAGMVLSFSGLEVNAVHAREVQNPQKNYPRAILIAAGFAFILLTMGALSISIPIPKEKISLVAGVMDAVRIMLDKYQLAWVFPVFALLLIIGTLGEVNAWVIGPVRGLFATAKHGDLPPILQKTNAKGIPYNLLLLQAVIVSLTALAFIFMPTASSAFWILSASAAQLYLIMYIIMFIAAIRLRYTHPHVERPYRIPHKHKGMWLVASIGILMSLFALTLGFLPPQQLDVGSLAVYETFIIATLVTMSIFPVFLFIFRKESWTPHKQQELSHGTEKQISDR